MNYFLYQNAGTAEVEHDWWKSTNRGEFVCKRN